MIFKKFKADKSVKPICGLLIVMETGHWGANFIYSSTVHILRELKMKRSEVIKIIDETYSVTPEYLWDGETHAVFRHPVSNKWFGIIMEVKKKNLHIEGCECSDETEDVMNVKANPVLIEDLLHEQTFLPGYHMNKKYWVSIRLEFVTETVLKKLIDESWNLVKPKIKKSSAR